MLPANMVYKQSIPDVVMSDYDNNIRSRSLMSCTKQTYFVMHVLVNFEKQRKGKLPCLPSVSGFSS